MTREEAIMVLKNEQPHCGKRALFTEEKKYEAYDVAIKALEQEPVTDKIRAEISAHLSNAEKDSKRTQDDIDCGICVGLQRALDTIDKYMSESVE